MVNDNKKHCQYSQQIKQNVSYCLVLIAANGFFLQRKRLILSTFAYYLLFLFHFLLPLYQIYLKLSLIESQGFISQAPAFAGDVDGK